MFAIVAEKERFVAPLCAGIRCTFARQIVTRIPRITHWGVAGRCSADSVKIALKGAALSVDQEAGDA